jgi:hypothetical protein
MRGQGKLTFLNGDFYIGPVNDQLQPHGKGIKIYKDGTKYEGDFINGYSQGKGKLIEKKSGKIYEGLTVSIIREGNFTAGLFTGAGKKTTKTKTTKTNKDDGLMMHHQMTHKNHRLYSFLRAPENWRQTQVNKLTSEVF